MKQFKRFALALSFCLFAVLALAQPTNIQQPEPNDFMHSNGKIYVVMAVVTVIVTGLFIYLFTLDKKMSRLEKNSRKQ